MPHLLRHGPVVYNGHLRGPVTLTPVAERLAVELSLPVFTTKVCRDRGSNPDLPQARRTLYLFATAAVKKVSLIATLFSKIHTDPQYVLVLSFAMHENTSNNLDAIHLRTDLPY